MNAIPTPPKKTVVQKGTGMSVTIDPSEKAPKNRQLNERLIHKPLQNHQGLNDLRDRLEFAPKGEEHKPR